MIHRAFTIIGLVGVSHGAIAAPFHVLSYEGGGGIPGVVGTGYSVDFGGFFTADSAGNNVVGGNSSNFTAFNEQEFDSHFALDGFGPSARNRTLTPGNNSNMTLSFYGDYGGFELPTNYNELEGGIQGGGAFGPFNKPGAVYVQAPGSHIGDPNFDNSSPDNLARAGMAVSPPPVLSHFAPNVTGGRSAHHGVFVGRFTIKEDAILSGGMVLNTFVAPGMFDTHELILGGPSVLFQTSSGPQHLSLRAYQLSPSSFEIENPSAAAGDGETPFGAAKVIDLWVQVPGPSTTCLLILFATSWRRRTP